MLNTLTPLFIPFIEFVVGLQQQPKTFRGPEWSQAKQSLRLREHCGGECGRGGAGSGGEAGLPDVMLNVYALIKYVYNFRGEASL